MATEPQEDDSPPEIDETIMNDPDNKEDVPEYIYDADSLLNPLPIAEGEIEMKPQEQELNFILQQGM